MLAFTELNARCAAQIRRAGRMAVVTAALAIAAPWPASAHIGRSFLEVPGVKGGWKGAEYTHWVMAEASYWYDDQGLTFNRRNRRRTRTYYSGPDGPKNGAHTLQIAVDKTDPALHKLMALCAKHTKFPEMTYAEASQRTRSLREIGPRPADIPEYYEYKLKNAQITDCPTVEQAHEQAFVISYDDIAWVNYHGEDDGQEMKLEPAVLNTVKTTGATKSFIVSWFAVANDVADDQCSKMNPKPTEADYFAMMSKEEADKERAAMKAGNTGISFENGQMAHRGPHKLDVCLLPGIMPDPGQVAPQITKARGLNLDGSNGTGPVPGGTCKHAKYVGDDGSPGVDNQLFRVMGCMNGYMGHKGYLMQYSNEQRRNGLISMLVQVTGIDDEQNDDSVDVAIVYGKDKMIKNASGTKILGDYTFRLSDDPEYTHYFVRVHGKIVNGTIITDPTPQIQIHTGLNPELTLYKASMRLKILPDGSLKGVIGGYEDWRRLAESNNNSNEENLYGFQCPAMYAALRRYADGLKNPNTGECDGISSAYDIEGSPAFIPDEEEIRTLRVQSVSVPQAQQGGGGQ